MRVFVGIVVLSVLLVALWMFFESDRSPFSGDPIRVERSTAGTEEIILSFPDDPLPLELEVSGVEPDLSVDEADVQVEEVSPPSLEEDPAHTPPPRVALPGMKSWTPTLRGTRDLDQDGTDDKFVWVATESPAREDTPGIFSRVAPGEEEEETVWEHSGWLHKVGWW